ncbi:unnamed protein product [Paramecium primaurelia]|uniref:Uncharacterized protein n=1 Tax=Paramecium primaurelia TaxID=5886 RepID=A0A8S1LXM8_PARPR|nr:unnamed protein product [Paramecium primaurelia]
MLKLNQLNEHLDVNIKPNITENNMMDSTSEVSNSNACLNLSIQHQITQESQTQQFLQSEQNTQRSPLQYTDELIYSNHELLQGEINQFSSLEDLSLKLNNYIDSYLQELRQPQQFLEQLSLNQSESNEEDSSESICQRIYSKFVSQLNLSVIQSYDQISSIDEQNKDETPLSLSTPILKQNVEIPPEKSGSKQLFFQDHIHLTYSYPLSQA